MRKKPRPRECSNFNRRGKGAPVTLIPKKLMVMVVKIPFL
jgi:hypothetical protein